MIQNTTAEHIAGRLKQIFKDCADFNFRTVPLKNARLYLANFGTFSGREFITQAVLAPLAYTNVSLTDADSLKAVLCSSELAELHHIQDMSAQLLAGSAVVFADVAQGVCAFACVSRNDPGRSVSEPDGERVVRGSREGFIEKAADNVALLRKRLRTPAMKVVNLSVGSVSDTLVSVVYLQGVAKDTLVQDVLHKLNHLPLETVLDSGYLEQFLTDGNSKLFTEVGNSEKPDKVAAKIAEGRVAIICDGSPVVLTVPYLFVESLQSAEDYLKSAYYATFVRWVRFVSLVLSLYLPAFYIAVMEHHQNAIPYALYKKMVEARAEVPFGVFGELVVILLIFEIIREVGVRTPGAVGNAVSLVAGLVLGDAAVSAGIASAPMIMVAALTAITTFILPTYMNSTVLVRFANLFLARVLGVVGIALSITLLFVHLCIKTSFGVPYLYPFVPVRMRHNPDGLWMSPKKALRSEKRKENRFENRND